MALGGIRAVSGGWRDDDDPMRNTAMAAMPAALVVGRLMAGAAPACAQGVEIQAAIGVYQPLTDQVRATNQTTGQGSVYRLGTAPAFGARAVAWLSERFGVEVSVTRAAPSRTVAAAATASSPTTITMLSLGGVRRFRLGEAMSLRIGAGAARVNVAGTSYDTSSVNLETVTGGFAASAAVTRRLGERLAVVFGIEDWNYQLDEVRGAPSLVLSGVHPVRQNDLVISLRLAVRP